MEPHFDGRPPQHPQPPDRPSSAPGKGLWGILGAAGLIAFKFFGPILIFLKTGGSMLLSIFVYSTFLHWSWQMATAIVFLIFVHEMGHVIAAWALGMPVSAPLFIPFIGASITMKQNPRDAWSEALMAYGGPFAGCVGSWIAFIVAVHYDIGWLMSAAYISFIINLFNLIPVPPLDGGRICAAVSPWFWVIGLVLLLASIVMFHAWNSLIIVALVLVAAIPRMRQTLIGATSPELRAYYNTHISNRLSMALMYVGLIAALLLGYMFAHAGLTYLQERA